MGATAEQISQIAPGQKIRLTVESQPRSEGARKTIERLMRRDPANAKGLRRAQDIRRDRTNSYIRGNRIFHARPKAARVVRALPGRSWEMPMNAAITPDLASVAEYLTIENA
ncbi:MAG: hypothetical protein AAGI17_03845 [Planctomycetota bacterium]